MGFGDVAKLAEDEVSLGERDDNICSTLTSNNYSNEKSLHFSLLNFSPLLSHGLEMANPMD